MENYEIVIGLEVHAQLKTNSKIFCPASADFGGDPNTHISPVTMGMPGSLPVLNEKVVESAIMLGLALGCNIRNFNRFARKHYFYPDLPKGYQISQFEEPICEHGEVTIFCNDIERTIGITRIHMEEDAGKNMHDSRTQSSLIDLNRAGVPLLEIVSDPHLRSAQEASCYLKTLRQILRYLDICDGNMEEGSLRCDANISLRPLGSLEFGTRTEIKNLNSFKFVEKAIEYEAARQAKVLKEGGTIIQETRLFDSETGTTRPMRGKEGSADYRYFPDPDLPPLKIDEAWIFEIKKKLPKLPNETRKEFIDLYGLTEYDADTLTTEKEYVDFFLEVFNVCKNAKSSSNWLTTELFGKLNKEALLLRDSPITSKNLGFLIKRIDEEVISGKMAKEVFEEMWETGRAPDEIIENKGLKQITNPDEIRNWVIKVIQENNDQVSKYLGGNERVLGFLVGQVIKLSQGKANPKLVNDLIKEEINKVE